MEYGLYRLTTLRGAVYAAFDRYGNELYGGDFLLCLQMCFLGPIEYVPSPMIVYRVRTMPPASPLGDAMPLTVKNLLFGGKRMWKSWGVLSRGCHYLMRFRQVCLSRRVAGVLTYITAFVVRYKGRLATDVLLISCSILAAFPRTIWKYVRRVPLFVHLDSCMKRFLQRS